MGAGFGEGEYVSGQNVGERRWLMGGLGVGWVREDTEMTNDAPEYRGMIQ